MRLPDLGTENTEMGKAHEPCPRGAHRDRDTEESPKEAALPGGLEGGIRKEDFLEEVMTEPNRERLNSS